MPLPFRAIRLVVCFAAILAVMPAFADRASERQQFRNAYAAARQPHGDWRKLAVGLEAYPLFPYLELAALERDLTSVDAAAVSRFLARWPDTLPAEELRSAWLGELARRGDWAGFRKFWHGSTDPALRCRELQARLAGGEHLDYAGDLAGLWEAAKALPGECGPVIDAAVAAGVLTPERIWQRIEREAADFHADAIDRLAARLEPDGRAAAARIAAAIRDPAKALAGAGGWADTARARDAVAFGIARYARRNSAGAETLWAGLQDHFAFDESQRDLILHALAVFRATSYSDDAKARLDALPAAARDATTRAWQVRIGLASGDWAAVLAAIDAMPPDEASDSRWRYVKARVLAKLDRKAEAEPLFADLADEANFEGFLAADWLDQPYRICPRTLPDESGDTGFQRDAGLDRAFEFFALDWLPQARREWNFAYPRLDGEQRLRAVDLAYRRGWYDRPVFALSAEPSTQRYYTERFPLALESRVRRDSRATGLDPAWTYAIIRAESAWMTDARSGADALGLMQLLPGVARELARASKLPYGGRGDLFDPAINIDLGTRYLAQMAGRYDGSPWLASAAYNAGTVPVDRWIAARGTLEPDFFIETIPYRETREYVARVLAFSVIYDWRMHGSALPLSARMPRVGEPFRIPGDMARKTVACDAESAPDEASPRTVSPPG